MPELASDAQTLCWSTGRTKTTATWSPVNDQSWSSFVHWLEPDQPGSSKEIRPYVGGTLKRGQRTIRTVEQRFFLTLDADYADEDFVLDVATLLHDTPYLIHTTWRHDPDANEHRYRLIIPLDRGIEPKEYKELAWTVMNRLVGSRFDVTTAQAERFMWAPSSKDEATYFWTAPNAGSPYLPADVWLDGHHGPSESPAATGQGKGTPATPATPSEALSASAEDIERAEEILAEAVADVLHLRERDLFSGRNEAVFHLLPLLLRFAEAGALDEDLVLDSLFNATQQVEADEPYTRQEFNASVQSARQYAEEDGPILPETTRTRLAQMDFADIEVEEEIDLWAQTPRLAHIAQAADNLGRNRLAMLAAVLVRVLARVDAGVLLAGAQDGSVGSRAALNLGVALVGSSGQGKSTIQDQSGVLVPTPGVEGKPSTGQGLIQEYLRWDEDDQTHHVISDPRRLFFFDEVDTLSASAADKTSTLMSEIRTMLTGGATGTANATAQRKRFLPARSYNFQMILNVQPSRAGGLLRDRDAGTPQRFIWVTVTDPERAVRPKDRPLWPGPLNWSDAFLLEYEMGQREYVDMPQWLKDELLEYDYRVSQEGMEGGEVSWAAHQNLLRLKVATGIAFLHESPIVETEHVVLADQIIRDSMKVQRACEVMISKTTFDAEVAKIKSSDRVLETVAAEKITRLVKNARKHLAAAPAGEWVHWKELRPAHRDRAEWGDRVWEALEADPTVETQETEIKSDQVRREARFIT